MKSYTTQSVFWQLQGYPTFSFYMNMTNVYFSFPEFFFFFCFLFGALYIYDIFEFLFLNFNFANYVSI